MSRTLPLLLVLATSGCTATLATIRLMEADRAVAAASQAGAATAAPYEYTLATRHRDEAWDASAHSQYKVAVDLSRTAVTWAEQAKVVATGGTRDVRQVGDDLTDEKTEDPFEEERGEPTPAPAPRPPTPRGDGDLDDEDFNDDPEDEPRRPR